MLFGLLGPLLVQDRDIDCTPTAPKQRQMLALILANANRVVSMSQLVEELWGLEPPQSAVAAVHTYIRQLRRTLQATRKDDDHATSAGRLITRGSGYLIEVRRAELDLHCFQAAVRGASNAIAAGDNEMVADRLRAALNIWRGPVLVDVTVGPVLSATIDAIERQRLDTVGKRIRADLNLGWHHELIGELSALVRNFPTREDFAEQLMLALYRSGRGADALAAFHKLRLSRRKQLGAALSPRMHVLYRDILAGHPHLDQPSHTSAGLSLDLFKGRAA